MPKYKNLGGIFRMREKDGGWRIIKHGEVFEVKEEDIPEAFKDIIVSMEVKRKINTKFKKSEPETEAEATTEETEAVPEKPSKKQK